MKVYIKKGLPNYNEKKLIKELQAEIERKIADDSSFSFTPARSYDELKALHKSICITDVDFEEVKEESKKPKVDDEEIIDATSEEKKETAPKQDEVFEKVDYDKADPLNREEPIVRPYVLEDEFTDTKKELPKKSTFEEPKSFGDSFSTEEYDIEKKDEKKGDSKSSDSKKSGDSSSNDSNSKKKKRNKRFAKYIVEGVVYLAKKGCIWYATKDITEAKILEYQLNGDISAGVLQLLVTLDNGQTATVKDFFARQIIKSEKIFDIDNEKKEDLIEALEEWMADKGFEPSPTQNLMIVGFSILGEPLVEALKMSAENNTILMQLKDITTNTQEGYSEPPPQQQATQQPQAQTQSVSEEPFIPSTSLEVSETNYTME